MGCAIKQRAAYGIGYQAKGCSWDALSSKRLFMRCVKSLWDVIQA